MTRRVQGCLAMMALVIAAGLSVSLAATVSYVTFEQITVAGSSIGFTVARIRPVGRPENQVQHAVCRLETAEIRWTTDGTTPTSSVGVLLEVGDILQIDDPVLILNFRAIRTTGVSGQLDCVYTAP